MKGSSLHARSVSCLLALVASVCMAASARALAPQSTENDVQIHDLPTIESGMTVASLMAMAPFSQVAVKKIELRVVYDDGGVVKIAEPTASAPGGGTFGSWLVERYAPGFVREGNPPTTKFDGEHQKKLLRTTAIAAGSSVTFKDKGGAVAVIVKKASGMVKSPTFLEQPIPMLLLGLGAGFVLGWLLFKLTARPKTP